MALLRANDVAKMNQQEKDSKIKELKMQLSKANVTAHKANSKTKEIKRALARIFTSQKLSKLAEEVAKKK